jgi:hypothetical protein
VVTPRGHAALRLALLFEDEAQQYVEAANGKQEKGRDECKVVHMMREDGGTDSKWHDPVSEWRERMRREKGSLQALDGTQWAETKVGTKHWEVSTEKFHRPPNLREDECKNLEDD